MVKGSPIWLLKFPQFSSLFFSAERAAATISFGAGLSHASVIPTTGRGKTAAVSGADLLKRPHRIFHPDPGALPWASSCSNVAPLPAFQRGRDKLMGVHFSPIIGNSVPCCTSRLLMHTESTFV